MNNEPLFKIMTVNAQSENPAVDVLIYLNPFGIRNENVLDCHVVCFPKGTGSYTPFIETTTVANIDAASQFVEDFSQEAADEFVLRSQHRYNIQTENGIKEMNTNKADDSAGLAPNTIP